MRYRETKERSGEILRLALQQMGRHDAAFHPLAYSVWYEYAAGINLPLAQAIEAIVEQGGTVGEREIVELHTRHITEREVSAAKQVEAGLRRIIDEIESQAESAGSEATRYGETLGLHITQLQRHSDQSAVSLVIKSLVEQTVEMRGSLGELRTRLESSSREVGELRDALQRVEDEAMLDPLTGVKNRRGFERAACELLSADADAATVSLLMIDIDNFKRVNDSYGHLFGDQVIRAVAHALQSVVKGRDTVARYGGEEFAVLLPATPLAGARTVAESIRSTIEKSRIRRLDNSEYVGGVTISIGVAASRASEAIEELVQRADEALYESKKKGRNRITVAETVSLR